MPPPARNNFNLTQYRLYVQNTQVPEVLRDLAYRLFVEVRQRWTGCRVEETGFEGLNSYSLDRAFLLTVNELIRRAHQ